MVNSFDKNSTINEIRPTHSNTNKRIFTVDCTVAISNLLFADLNMLPKYATILYYSQ